MGNPYWRYGQDGRRPASVDQGAAGTDARVEPELDLDLSRVARTELDEGATRIPTGLKVDRSTAT
jgi:hypothetical protein